MLRHLFAICHAAHLPSVFTPDARLKPESRRGDEAFLKTRIDYSHLICPDLVQVIATTHNPRSVRMLTRRRIYKFTNPCQRSVLLSPSVRFHVWMCCPQTKITQIAVQ